ncbi:uncharacterized protein [Blastocystis hominis]|uniref:C3H1-type domain-containing protein n=1 Tax=Blastocystis hominis TaxID=12968 RepID=D8M7H2_BLAHO|nr:uncharacterized protein [Blastocystis hominis]CBK24011.2 unnamed protein product [Blastocystis hominis]|eukprot:XP_012898059.1 uncharacterized protein [Blastocystis hominis]
MSDFHFNFEETVDILNSQTPTVSPKEKKDIVCRHWLKHECQRGDACAYLHEFIPDKVPECELGARCLSTPRVTEKCILTKLLIL